MGAKSKKKTSEKSKKNQNENTGFSFLIIPILVAFLAFGFGYQLFKEGVLVETVEKIEESLFPDTTYRFFINIPRTYEAHILQLFNFHFDKKDYITNAYGMGHNNRLEDPLKFSDCYTGKYGTEKKFISGAFNYGVHCCIEDYKYYVVLRDPVKRVISHFSYDVHTLPRRNSNINTIHKDFIKANENKPIEEKFKSFINDKRFLEVDNGMVRRISGVGDTVPYGKLTTEHLRMAKKNLEKNFVVGINEDFIKFQMMIEHEFGLNIELGNNNLASTDPRSLYVKIGKDLEDELRIKNELDLKLYKHAKRISNKQFDRLPKKFRDKYYKVVRKK